ncbi:hypothetical protein Salat_2614300 [Sesamum alatum]|uniref:PB1-like domain-containing protein n=1 Tax=Sesamum alatum TaxID=300844 RepID=A0AAE1XND1_9LAMI|nr:hypothetical protein Salat_2614300 [Sesamum alatum]
MVTAKIHHGGEIFHSPEAHYVGGVVASWDYFDVDLICMSYLDTLADQLGYSGPKNFYRLDVIKFREIVFQTDLLQLTDDFVNKNREINFYLEAQLQNQMTQIGSSNPVKKMQPANVVDNVVEENENDGRGGFNHSDYDLSDDGENDADGEGDSEGDEVLESGDDEGDVPDGGLIAEEGNAGVDEVEESGEEKGCPVRKAAEELVADLNAKELAADLNAGVQEEVQVQ